MPHPRESYRRSDPEDSKERCAVSGDLCDGVCSDRHQEEFSMRCPAWYTDDMIKRKRKRERE